MKKNKLLSLTILLPIALLALNSCGNSLGYKEGDILYTKTPVFDLSDPSARLSFEIELNGSITSIKSGRIEISDYNYDSANKVLTLSGEQLESISNGEKTLTIKTSEKSYSQKIMMCTKIIKTAQDFQDINNELEGTYVLGNDINLSTISNFEPLGRFVSETDISNKYFHGIFDGNGYTISNAMVKYSDTDDTNQAIATYTGHVGTPLFKDIAHQAGDNIGIFQIIGSSGIVRNTVFKDCEVYARTIGGIIAGNNSGNIENCLVSGGKVNISTHFWDNDCNTGSVAGINAGSGIISNVISTGKSSITSTYIDYSDDYIGQVATGGEHSSDQDPYWTFWGADRVNATTKLKEIDSNNHNTNGVYSFVGKSWGTVNDSFGLSYKVTPFNGVSRDVDFGQTHLGVNKPTSGDSNMGEIKNCSVKTEEELKNSTLYSGFDADIWNIKDNKIPNIKAIYPTK